ncbi:MAG: hypothetical protein M1133_00940 [Armatimonadetes bacterium]|nr:hypothetical protein [Armatimonadota bacterium]
MSLGRIISRRVAAILAALFAVPVVTSPSLSQNAVDSATGMITDVVVGHNNKGPYPLSYTRMAMDSMSVVLGGRTLRKGADYNIDSEKGIISFNSIVVNDAIIRVSYKIVPGKSVATSGKMNVPVTVNLLQDSNANLNVTGLYAQDDPKNPNAGKTVIGVGGDKAWSGSKLTSQFLLSQHNNDRSDKQASVWDRSAIKLGNEMKLGAITLNGTYMHSGNDFLGAKEYGTGLGKNITDLNAVYAANKSFQAIFKFKDTDDTTAAAKGAYTRSNEQQMIVAPADATKLSLTHSTTETGNNTGSKNTVESSVVKVDQGIGGNLNANVSVGTEKVTAGDQTSETQTEQVGVSGTVAQGVNVQAAAVQKNSQANGGEQKITGSVTIAPNKILAVDAKYQGIDSDKNGQSTNTDMAVRLKPADNVEIQAKLTDQEQDDKQQYQRDFTLSSTPSKTTKLTALFSQHGVNEVDDITKGAMLEIAPFSHTRFSAGYKYIENGSNVMTIRDYAASTSPTSLFSFSGSWRERQAQTGFAPDTKKMNVALNPASSLSLTGDYQENPEDNAGAIQAMNSKAVGMRMRIGSVGLLTDYTSKDEYIANKLSDERKIGLELPAFGRGKLTTGYKLARLLSGSELSTRTYSLGYKRLLGGDFNLSLSGYYTQYMQNQMTTQDKEEYGAEASLNVNF